MNDSLLSWIIVVGIAIAFFTRARRADRAREARQTEMSKEWEVQRLSDENIANVQERFENRLVGGIDLPDSIRWKDAYVYWQLMRGWFATLAARHRYDDRLNKLKQDWLAYMSLKEDYATYGFLSAEGKEEKRDAYSQSAHEAKQQLQAIEDAFAHAIGPEAVAELKKIRKADLKVFDRTGRGKMAPPGFKYRTVSVNPWTEELVRE